MRSLLPIPLGRVNRAGQVRTRSRYSHGVTFTKRKTVEGVKNMVKKAVQSDDSWMKKGSLPPKAPAKPISGEKKNPKSSSDSPGSGESSGSGED